MTSEFSPQTMQVADATDFIRQLHEAFFSVDGHRPAAVICTQDAIARVDSAMRALYPETRPFAVFYTESGTTPYIVAVPFPHGDPVYFIRPLRTHIPLDGMCMLEKFTLNEINSILNAINAPISEVATA